MRTLVLSDLHLGGRNCHADQILDVLQREAYDRLVLNGDTLNSLNLRKLTPSHWAVVARLRGLPRSREVILLRGNHDHEPDGVPGPDGAGSRDVLPALLGVPMVEEDRLEIGGRPSLVLHRGRFHPTPHHPVVPAAPAPP